MIKLLFIMISINIYASNNIDKAINFLEKACVTKGSKVEIIANGKASLTIKNWKNTGIYGEIKFSKSEVEGLSDKLNKL